MKRVVGGVCVMMLCLAMAAAPAWASNEQPRKGRFGKLGRGVANVLTGWLEIPFQVAHRSRTEGVASGLTVGLARGIGWSLGRTVLGIAETITFPIPNYPGEFHQPDGQPFGPYMKPEFVGSTR